MICLNDWHRNDELTAIDCIIKYYKYCSCRWVTDIQITVKTPPRILLQACHSFSSHFATRHSRFVATIWISSSGGAGTGTRRENTHGQMMDENDYCNWGVLILKRNLYAVCMNILSTSSTDIFFFSNKNICFIAGGEEHKPELTLALLDLPLHSTDSTVIHEISWDILIYFSKFYDRNQLGNVSNSKPSFTGSSLSHQNFWVVCCSFQPLGYLFKIL